MSVSAIRKKHLRDFRERAVEQGTGALLGTEYVTIHPFSDDEETLARLEWSVAQCTSVDAYWLVDHDVAFVQMLSRPNGSPDTYARWNRSTEYVNIVCTIGHPVVSRALFDTALRNLLKDGLGRRLLQVGAALPERLTIVSALVTKVESD
jgi:hypothetical protein